MSTKGTREEKYEPKDEESAKERHGMEKAMKRAKGGTTEAEKDGIETGPRHRFTPQAPSGTEALDEKDGFKRGGRAKKKKGEKVDGEKSAPRLDKRAKGGRMGGGHSPLTAASKIEGRPGGKYDGEGPQTDGRMKTGPKLDAEDDEG